MDFKGWFSSFKKLEKKELASFVKKEKLFSEFSGFCREFLSCFEDNEDLINFFQSLEDISGTKNVCRLATFFPDTFIHKSITDMLKCLENEYQLPILKEDDTVVSLHFPLKTFLKNLFYSLRVSSTVYLSPNEDIGVSIALLILQQMQTNPEMVLDNLEKDYPILWEKIQKVVKENMDNEVEEYVKLKDILDVIQDPYEILHIENEVDILKINKKQLKKLLK